MSEERPAPDLVVPARREAVADEYHGVRVEDPNRWLEDANAPEVEAWVAAQNRRSEAWLAQVGERAELERRLNVLLRVGSISLPTLRRTRDGTLRLFYTRQYGEQEQPVLYVRDGLQGSERTLIDPVRELAGDDSNVALDWYEPSSDGSRIAYGVSRDGSEDSTLYVRDVESGERLPDRIGCTQHASVAWQPDGQGFFYTRYPARGSVPTGEERLHRKLFEHRLGHPEGLDRLLFEPELVTDFLGVSLSPNGRFLLVSVSRGWSETRLLLTDLAAGHGRFTDITPAGQHRYAALLSDARVYVLTNLGAARYRLLAFDPERPGPSNWQEIIAEHPTDVLRNFELSAGALLLSYLALDLGADRATGSSRLLLVDVEGQRPHPIALPAMGTNLGLSGTPAAAELFYGFESFVIAPQVFCLDTRSAEAQLWQAVSSDLSSDDFEVSVGLATSADGTRVPFHLVRRRGELSNGALPRATLLYGYGGFNETVLPRFSRSLPAWLERGHVYVQALLRGGGEFGEDWHQAGQREHKHHTFEDFEAVAEELFARGITTPEKLGLWGRSNGGLLVAATVTRQPELCAAAVASVPLTDMIRFPCFLIGKLWEAEYGSPEEPDTFAALFAYSPYHRVRGGLAYPAVLVTTASQDTRVDPLHARKWVAALQHATISPRPVLLRTELIGGHGAGASLSRQAAELTDIYAFLLRSLRAG